MKKILLFSFLLALSFASISQTRTTLIRNIQQGDFVDFGGTNLMPSDSLQVSDSIAYIIPITHVNNLGLYHTWYWQKVGAGTATVTLNFLQSNDPINFFPVKAGAANSNYSKTFSLSASGWNEVSFVRDTARFEGRYLKVQFITSSTANVKGYLFNRVKSFIK